MEESLFKNIARELNLVKAQIDRLMTREATSSPTLTTVEVNLGNDPLYSGTFDIAGTFTARSQE